MLADRTGAERISSSFSTSFKFELFIAVHNEFPLLQEQKKLQGQLITEQEALYGSKPSPLKPQIVKKGPRLSTGGASNRRLSMGGGTLQTPKREFIQSTKTTPQSRPSKHPDRMLQNDMLSNLRQDDSSAVPSAGKFLWFSTFLGFSEHSLKSRKCLLSLRSKRWKVTREVLSLLSFSECF